MLIPLTAFHGILFSSSSRWLGEIRRDGLAKRRLVRVSSILNAASTEEPCRSFALADSSDFFFRNRRRRAALSTVTRPANSKFQIGSIDVIAAIESVRPPMTICMQSIGTVRSPFTKDGVRMSRRDIIADIIVNEEFAAALTGIDEWSHLIILFWMKQSVGSQHRLIAHPRRRSDLPEVGLFSMRSRERPNPIGLAVVELLKRNQNVLTVRALDAYDGSPVLDIKPYDRYDAVADLRMPKWWATVSGSSSGKRHGGAV